MLYLLIINKSIKEENKSMESDKARETRDRFIMGRIEKVKEQFNIKWEINCNCSCEQQNWMTEENYNIPNKK